MARLSPLLLFLLGSAVFSAAYGQAPLYYSNQNQYFLHGLAMAGDGLLDEDWLANTADPTPLFSTLVAFTARYLHPWVFHLYHALLLGAYGAAMLGLFSYLAGREWSKRRWPLFLVVFVTLHSALARWLSYRLVGFDYPWFFQAGVAGQYILGAMLQPSFFGVLLVGAVCLFARGRPYLAAICTGLAADLHSTYLLPGGLLTLGFMTALLAQREGKTALGVGAIALTLVAPTLVFVLIQFGPTSPGEFSEAQDILVNLRIPHHARPDLWLDPVAGVQIAWMVLALALVRKTPLFAVFGVPFVLGLLLTLVQVATDSNTLALLFPWRISSILVPIATTMIVTRGLLPRDLPGFVRAATVRERASSIVRATTVRERLLPRSLTVAARTEAKQPLPDGRGSDRILNLASLFGVCLLAGAGAWITTQRLAFRVSDDEEPLMEFVRQHRSSGDTYLLPVRIPPPPKTRGSLSSDFMPLRKKKVDVQIIPVDLQRFRLHTGTPIFVDFKSIPYKDTEVIEWRDRLFLAHSLQDQLAKGQIVQALAEMRRRGITHLVTPARSPITRPQLEQVHEDRAYRVYRWVAPR